MKLLIGIILSLISFSLDSIYVEDCALENFVGTWKGKVVYEGDELSQGPFIFTITEDGKSLRMDDGTEAKHEMTVENCVATLTIEEEETSMSTSYTFKSDSLIILSKIQFPDPDGNPFKTEMTGFMTRVE